MTSAPNPVERWFVSPIFNILPFRRKCIEKHIEVTSLGDKCLMVVLNCCNLKMVLNNKGLKNLSYRLLLLVFLRLQKSCYRFLFCWFARWSHEKFPQEIFVLITDWHCHSKGDFPLPLFALPRVQTLRGSSKALARSGVVGLYDNHWCHLVTIKVWSSSNCSSRFITTRIG